MSRVFVTLLSLLVLAASSWAVESDTLSLAGVWRFSFEPEGAPSGAGPEDIRFEDSIRLPGTTAAQRKGPAERFDPQMNRETMARLRERHPYVGPAWYQRDVTIPADWEGSDVHLTLERVLWESRVWVDGKPLDKPQNSLSVPHRYNLSGRLTPGRTHTLTLRIDNREIIPLGSIGHAYTPGTQTLWNGVVGKMTLRARPPQRIDHVRVVARPNGSLTIDVEGDFQADQRLVATVSPKSDTDKSITPIASAAIQGKSGKATLAGHHGSAQPWSELSPKLYELSVDLIGDEGEVLDSRRTTFGFRQMTAEGRHLTLNGERVFLRGNLECAIFPLTGHADAEGSHWAKVMRTAREYGLNHLRFHSWCPPRAAFEAADRSGVYLQVELPNWTFKMGREPLTDEFLLAEGKRLIREYGNHPSFVLFSLGNELTGDLTAMDRLVERLRAVEPELLYTSTSFAFSPRGKTPGPADDFFISQRTASGWVRGQGFLNSTFPTTDSDYAEGMACLDLPLVTHEVGQYVVYPDLSTLPKYETTPLRATAMEAIREDLASKGLLGDAQRFTRDSGKLAALLYKEDIERALRTKGLAGIQLLQLQDFPGQSTATVGLLDAFWDSKGLITPEEFRRFSSPVVPLARMERFVWQSGETFRADLELANFAEKPIDAAFQVALVDSDGQAVASRWFDPRIYAVANGSPIGRFEAPLVGFEVATRLDLVVRGEGVNAENSWPVWVYPAEQATPQPIVHRAADEACLADLEAGRSVLLLPPVQAVRQPMPARFIPVFWSPLHFPNQPGTLGATIDTAHPLWKHFPTDTHANWQWWELTADSVAVDLSDYEDSIAKPFRYIDKFDRNALPTAIFEARVGRGRLLVCTLDVTGSPATRIVARQLLRALKHRATSTEFQPKGTLSPEQLQALFRPTAMLATASSSHRSHPAQFAVDGDPETIWHSDWNDPQARLPLTLQIDLQGESALAGITLANRNDKPNGRLRDYRVETSTDGERWIKQAKAGQMPNSGAATEFRFEEPLTARFLRIVAEAAHGNRGFASLAEVEVLPASAEDVRELGLIEGFND